LLLLLTLAGCAATRKEPFNEADFHSAAGPGSGTVTGHAYAVRPGYPPVDAAGEIVVVIPVTPYSTENIERRFLRGEHLRSADPRIDKYIRGVTADDQGRFTIRNVPPGEYFAQAQIGWTTSYRDTDSDGITTTMHVDHEKLIFARITVRDRQTTGVTTWNQQSRTHDGFYAYGGTLSHPKHQLVEGAGTTD
jgi:hypothetical protein